MSYLLIQHSMASPRSPNALQSWPGVLSRRTDEIFEALYLRDNIQFISLVSMGAEHRTKSVRQRVSGYFRGQERGGELLGFFLIGFQMVSP